MAKRKRSGKCGVHRISSGPMKGHYRNTCTGRLVKKPRRK